MHLRSLWADDCYRVFVDLGSLPGNGIFENTSDGHLWINYFNHSGIILSLDLSEISALDVAQRFRDNYPYNMPNANLSREVVVGGIGNKYREKVPRVDYLGICNGEHWRHKERALIQNYGTFDHFCRSWRHRHGFYEKSVAATLPQYIPLDPLMTLESTTIDDLWRNYLQSSHVDFLKIDVDRQWRDISSGMEALITNRAFSVMTFELDPVTTGSDLTDEVKEIVDLMARHDYAAFLKWPCGHFGHGYDNNHRIGPANNVFRNSPISGVDYVNTAYLPISGKYGVKILGKRKPGGRFYTKTYNEKDVPVIKLIGRKGVTSPQDILIMDMRQPELLKIVEMGNLDCGTDFKSDILS